MIKKLMKDIFLEVDIQYPENLHKTQNECHFYLKE